MPLKHKKEDLFLNTKEKKDSDRRGPTALRPVPGQIEVEIIE
jgi:hypothetical protein